jgi:hypothetical protein
LHVSNTLSGCVLLSSLSAGACRVIDSLAVRNGLLQLLNLKLLLKEFSLQLQSVSLFPGNCVGTINTSFQDFNPVLLCSKLGL